MNVVTVGAYQAFDEWPYRKFRLVVGPDDLQAAYDVESFELFFGSGGRYAIITDAGVAYVLPSDLLSVVYDV